MRGIQAPPDRQRPIAIRGPVDRPIHFFDGHVRAPAVFNKDLPALALPLGFADSFQVGGTASILSRTRGGARIALFIERPCEQGGYWTSMVLVPAGAPLSSIRTVHVPGVTPIVRCQNQ